MPDHVAAEPAPRVLKPCNDDPKLGKIGLSDPSTSLGSSLQGFNTLGAGDARSWSGMNPLGLEIVVDGSFAAKTMVITKVGTGFGDAFEYYEQQKGLMSVQVPSTLGRTMSYHMYASTFAAIPGMIRKITQA